MSDQNTVNGVRNFASALKTLVFEYEGVSYAERIGVIEIIKSDLISYVASAKRSTEHGGGGGSTVEGKIAGLLNNTPHRYSFKENGGIGIKDSRSDTWKNFSPKERAKALDFVNAMLAQQ